MAALQGPDGAGELFANMWLTASQPYWQMLSAWLYTVLSCVDVTV
jgi:hypothetical protein